MAKAKNLEDEELIAIYAKRNDAIRRQMYAEIADPLFFKWQRGLATEAEWLQAIKDVEDTEII